MVTIEKKRIIIEIITKHPELRIKELKFAIANLTSEIVVSDCMNYNENLFDSIATLLRLLPDLELDIEN